MARLIDADELIRQMSWKLGLGDEENGANVDYMEALEDCKGLIDNAPTVEPETKLVANITFNKEQLEKIIEKAKSDILSQIERQQGEWEFKKFDEETGISNSDWCPFCGKVKAQVYDNFCPNCGADMRKGGEE